MAERTPSRRGGFTLVEMLVVIAIIAILAAILIPVGNIAIKTARRAANGFEMAQIAQAIDVYKSANGGQYPPSFGEGGNNATFYANAFATNNWRNTRLGRYVMKCYPKAAPTDIQALFNNADSLDQCSALPFWLTQTSADPRYPFTGATKRSYISLDESRVVQGPGGGIRPKHAGESFYIYIESSHYPFHVTNNLGGVQSAAVPAGSGPPASRTPDVSVRPWVKQTPTDPVFQNNFINKDTFQLHCAGLDSRFSVNHDWLRVYPCGATGLKADGSQQDPNEFSDDRDNQTNFSEGGSVTDRPAQ